MPSNNSINKFTGYFIEAIGMNLCCSNTIPLYLTSRTMNFVHGLSSFLPSLASLCISAATSAAAVELDRGTDLLA